MTRFFFARQCGRTEATARPRSSAGGRGRRRAGSPARRLQRRPSRRGRRVSRMSERAHCQSPAYLHARNGEEDSQIA